MIPPDSVIRESKLRPFFDVEGFFAFTIQNGITMQTVCRQKHQGVTAEIDRIRCIGGSNR